MIEFKIYQGDRWEDTPVFMTVDERVMYPTSSQGWLAHTIAKWLAEEAETEVRWNWGGSPQGHYVGTRRG